MNKMQMMISLFILGSMLGCQEQISPEQAWTHQYWVTGCANDFEVVQDREQTEEYLTVYLANEGIEVQDYEYAEYDLSQEIAFCLACTCHQGDTIRIRVSAADSVALNNLQLPDYQQWRPL